MNLTLVPIPCKRGQRWVKRVHRRLKKVQGAMWVGPRAPFRHRLLPSCRRWPNARVLDANGDEAPQPNLQVLRVACIADVADNGHKGACSMLYAACARAARAMGASNLWTYIHDDEPGTSLRAAGWIEDTGFESTGGSYDRPSRKRNEPVEGGPKKRWFAPWSAMVLANQRLDSHG